MKHFFVKKISLNWIYPILIGISFIASLYFFRQPSFFMCIFSFSMLVLFFGIWLERYKSWCFFLVSILISICLIEVMVPRVLSWGVIPTISSMEGGYTNKYFVPDELMGTLAKPGVSSSKKIVDGKIVYDVLYSIGNDGYRVTPKEGYKRPSLKGINFFGCSFTFGEGVNDNQTLPYFYQKLSNQEVKNYGFHGYGVHQALVRLKNFNGKHTDHINFLLTAPWHSERSSCGASYSKGSPQFILENELLIEKGKCGLYIYQRLADFIASSSIYSILHSYWVSNLNQNANIELYLKLIQEMGKVSKDRNEEFYVGFIRADNGWFKGSYTNEKIISSLQAMGIKTIDLSLANDIKSLSSELYIADDGHPSPKAHSERAKLLFEFINKP